MANKITPFGDSLKRNHKTYVMFYNRLFELAINSHEWVNLPDTIDPRYLEIALFTMGHALFFEDKELDGYLALRCNIQAPFDVYMVGTQRHAFSANGYTRMLTNKDSVVIFNNYSRTNCLYDIEEYAERLYQIQRAIDVNVSLQKHMKLIACSENQQLVMKQLMMNYEGNIPFVFGDKSFDPSSIVTLDIAAPFVADKLQILKRQIWNEALTYLGIENSNTEKKERLVSTEVDTNLGGVEAQRFTRLNARRDAAKKINSMFNLNISVKFREETPEVPEEPTQEDGDEDNE